MTEAEKEVGEMLGTIREELARARAKWPGRNLTIVALMEEVGELAKAAMDEPRERVFKEAVQVAVMAMRVWLDGDHSVEYRRAQNGVKPLRMPVHDLAKQVETLGVDSLLPGWPGEEN